MKVNSHAQNVLNTMSIVIKQSSINRQLPITHI